LKKAWACFLVAFLFLLAVSGCSSSEPGSVSRPAEAAADRAEYTADEAGLANGTQSTAVSNAKNQSVTDSRKVIKNAELTLQSVQYDEVNKKLESLVASFGGYIESSSVQGDTSGNSGLRSSSYTVRVPSDRLTEFLTCAGDIGNVIRKSMHGEDVTQNYFDSETRLKTLRTEQDRLLELMKQADKMDDILKIEERLTQVQSNIEQLTGQLKQWDSLISLSTVTISVKEVEAITEPPEEGLGWQLVSIFRGSLTALRELCRYTLFAVTAALPFLAVAAVIGGAVLFLRRKFGRRANRGTPPDKKDKPDINTK
jgi:hypothetical protein